jgi:hypothetical protein
MIQLKAARILLTLTVFWLFQSREWLQLKVLEVHPQLTKLGASLKEASELQRAHDEVLLQLQVQRHGILSRSAILAVHTDGLLINSKCSCDIMINIASVSA